MADGGYLLSGIINDMGVKLHMPLFKGTERTQLTSSETIRDHFKSKIPCYKSNPENENIPHIRWLGQIIHEGYCRRNIYSLFLFGEFSKPYCQRVAIQYTCINEQFYKVHHDIYYCHRKRKYLLIDVDMYQLYQIDS